MHEVLVNRLGGLSLPRKSVVRLTDRPDMTLDVYRGRKTTMQLILTATALQCTYQNLINPLMDGWITCHFTSFSTVFQSYQDSGSLIRKGCVQWTTFMIE